MDYEKIGSFLRELRVSKNMSQYDLAMLMHVDHSKINRLENNKRRPNFDDLMYYSQIFDISLDELIACERKNKQNSKKLQVIFFKYLQNQNSKLKKVQFIVILLIILIVFGFIGLIITYFFQNYDAMRIYTFYGSSPSYEITDGLLVLSKEKIYFQIGNINPEVENIRIFSEINNKRHLVYNGKYQTILQDSYGYESFISYQNFINGNQKFFVEIDNQEIELNFIEEIANNNFIYMEENNIGEEQEIVEFLIPKKITENFQCDENKNCTLIDGNNILIYNSGFFYVNNDLENYTYDVNSGALSYYNLKNEINFEIINNNINCLKGNCKSANKVYENFYKNYVEKYLK